MGNHDEKIALVDKDNKVIGYKDFSELADSDTWRIVSIWIENNHGQVLLQQRSYKKPLGPGLWTPAVEGTVDGDDSYHATAIREVEEEIGLRDIKLTPTHLMHYRSSYGSRIVQGFTAQCNKQLSEFVIQTEEVEQLAWRDKAEVLAEINRGDPKYPSTAKVWLWLFNLV